jgi:hypothetical protein
MVEEPQRNEAIRIQLTSYEGRNLVNIRTWWQDDEGRMKPGKGFACSVRHLPTLAKAINAALERARELKLIDEGAG